jgi:molybdenum cofactor cytidylyltransferase
MGRPKQLLEMGGQALVVRAAQACFDAGIWPVVVVLGANSELIKPALARLPVITAVNAAWAQGMAGSLRAGIATLQQFSREVPAALICLCDQPGFSADAAQRLQRAWQRRREDKPGISGPIAASQYAGRMGAPAIFDRSYFGALSNLKGDEGARALLQACGPEVMAVDLPELAVDLDTPEDYAAAVKNHGPRILP